VSWLSDRALVPVATAALFALANPANGQVAMEPEDAPVQFGPLAVSPEIEVANLGFDSNVFSENDARNPESALTARVGPSVAAWLRLPRARIATQTELDYVYYDRFSDLRSWDTDNALRAELSLGRFTPYAAGSWVNSRHGFGVEIDVPVRRLERAAELGADVKLSVKTSINVNATRSRTDFEDDENEALRDGVARNMTRTVTGEGFSFRYEVTPFTTVALDVARQRERFGFSPGRDADSVWIGPAVEFKPLAVVSGRAEVGVRRRTFLDGEGAEYRGLAMLLNLRYTLLERTRFAVDVERDLKQSYRLAAQDYLLTGVTASVVHRLADPWDVRATVGRARLTYGVGAPGAIVSDVETLLSSRVEVGFRMRRARLAVYLDYRARQADRFLRREYDRVRVASSVTYSLD
jgi:hypothetical protein